jgi:hypothetical protein
MGSFAVVLKDCLKCVNFLGLKFKKKTKQDLKVPAV